ncbi:MAG TPA: hypothetical protein VNE63_01055, partial [Candidatus Acidoferrales bacterium]|nr:hypothetical protein [Candidatus Acidoferrales bacterium]
MPIVPRSKPRLKTTYTSGAGGLTWYQSFNAAGRATQITSSWSDSQHPATLVSGVHYNAQSSVTADTLGNGLTDTAAFNPRLQPCRMNVNSSGTVLGTCTDAVPPGNVLDLNVGFNYGSGDNGNVVSWTAVGAQTFTRSYPSTSAYDGVNRLIAMTDSASGATCKGLSWSYDAWGNRLTQTPTAGTCNAWNASYNTSNQPTTSGYQFDAAGNMTHDASHSYTYDAENRITQVDGGSTASYIYDAEGHRVQKTAGGVTTNYV